MLMVLAFMGLLRGQPNNGLIREMLPHFLLYEKLGPMECAPDSLPGLNVPSLLTSTLDNSNQRAVQRTLKPFVHDLEDRAGELGAEFEPLAQPLWRFHHFKIVVTSDDGIDAYWRASDSVVCITSGLIRDDLLAVLSSATLCGFEIPMRYPHWPNQRIPVEQLRGVEVAMDFILSFQVLHEYGHAILGHSGEPDSCEESAADAFAVAFMSAAEHAALWTPSHEWPFDWALPADVEEVANQSSHPIRAARIRRILDAKWGREVLLERVPRMEDWYDIIIAPALGMMERYQAANRLCALLDGSWSPCH